MRFYLDTFDFGVTFEEIFMTTKVRVISLAAGLGLAAAGYAQAANYHETLELFEHAGQSAAYFGNSYAYAVFPTIGEGGFVVGGAHGDGRVYEHSKLIGKASMTQVSVGFQAGGQAYSEIIFFENQQALDAFESGNYQFSADAGAVAITAAASASAGTSGGGQAGASGGDKNAIANGSYKNGVAIFTIAKGGLMYDAVVAGQKFSFKPVGA
jgi:lipid-binding SYLF domain-containing protein